MARINLTSGKGWFRIWLARRMILHSFRTSVKTVTDPQLKPRNNGHQLRKVPRAMRNFSYLKEFFLLTEIVRPTQTGNNIQEIST